MDLSGNRSKGVTTRQVNVYSPTGMLWPDFFEDFPGQYCSLVLVRIGTPSWMYLLG